MFYLLLKLFALVIGCCEFKNRFLRESSNWIWFNWFKFGFTIFEMSDFSRTRSRLSSSPPYGYRLNGNQTRCKLILIFINYLSICRPPNLDVYLSPPTMDVSEAPVSVHHVSSSTTATTTTSTSTAATVSFLLHVRNIN